MSIGRNQKTVKEYLEKNYSEQTAQDGLQAIQLHIARVRVVPPEPLVRHKDDAPEHRGGEFDQQAFPK